ncbi:hypothetical protein Pu29_orf00008 [Salmonella phage Pu29]|uniref:Uncharacterized protein n=3 Tax=Caudoviricetes TaxID=2731619 RepID=A0A6B9LQA2_9CAUD|nr:hypothetical protein [Salmonella enterica]YP_010053434.1 hypothetical protein KGB40_gp62 [Salmonella phage Segz_1]YP_010053907.1 hypothetical protein KGB46_gp55 [Salmonella phage VB_StyS_BS5]YP_010657385.1 hypothetical protein PP739_gp18 [Salmonella phage LPSTLL]QXV72003.1 hypothetical protein [Salmonella phage D10]WDE69710.1 hypothetical protein Pu29_orf00008 [Salmonella phage Pu29]MBF4541118.1 hypothetical protein [Salmonella enterica subsp. enterica serovar Typhimurium]QAX98711.1 hypot
MFPVIKKEQYDSLCDSEKTNYPTKGMTAQLRDQFSKMDIGDGFVYPVSQKKYRRVVSSRLKGTCNYLGVIIRTKTVDDGILVVFEGYK